MLKFFTISSEFSFLDWPIHLVKMWSLMSGKLSFLFS